MDYVLYYLCDFHQKFIKIDGISINREVEGLEKTILITAIVLCFLLVLPLMVISVQAIHASGIRVSETMIRGNSVVLAEIFVPNDPGSGGGGQGVLS